MNRMLAAILAGGKGKRMGVLCQVRPKPALPFAGKYRMIDFSLSNSVHSQVKDIAIFVDFQRTNLVNYIQRWKQTNRMISHLDVLPPQNEKYSGTADALYQHIQYLRRSPADRVLIMPSDHVYKMDYSKMLAFHDKSKADVTVGVVTVPAEEASRFGIISTEKDGRVSDYNEKPALPKTDLASMGVYIFNKDVLIERLVEDAGEPDSIHDFGYSIIDRMARRDRVYAYQYSGFWRDIGTIDAYYAANLELLNKRISFGMDEPWPILTAPDNTETVKKFVSANVENSIIGPGCVIKGKVVNSVLSPGVFVDEQAIVRNSVLMSNVFVGYHSVVESCIADEDVNIGKYCYIGFGTDQTRKPACSVLGAGANVSSRIAIARGARVEPFAKLTESIALSVIEEKEDVEMTRNTVLV